MSRAMFGGLYGLLSLIIVGSVPATTWARTPRPQLVEQNGTKVARLKVVTARQSQKAWMGVKALPPGRQAAAARDQRLYQQVCSDLVDMRQLVESRKLTGFGFRDNVRQRTWARPSLALLLVTAMERLQTEMKGRARIDRVISIGDVSQQGCGQLAHGVLVFAATGERAATLARSARLIAGRNLVQDLVRAGDFPWESDRFGLPDERVLVEYELLGEDERGLRHSRTRYREVAIAAGDVMVMAREVEGLWGKANAVKVADHQGDRWVVHAVDPQRDRQVQVTFGKKPGRRLDWRDVLEVRLASWQDKKPGSFPGEMRWRVESVPAEPVSPSGKRPRPTPLAADALGWTRWSLVNEAGHISHLSGIDADLSYVTVDNDRHFAIDLEAMDVKLTWRWLEILEQTARELGTPLDGILVDAKIKRHFMSRLPQKGPESVKNSRVWRLLTLVGGHDAHHHIRIVEASDAVEKKARQALGL